MKKPFDVFAEGLISEKSRGDWTPLELFVARVREWPSTVAQAAQAFAVKSDTDLSP